MTGRPSWWVKLYRIGRQPYKVEKKQNTSDDKVMQCHTICCSHGSTSLPSLVHYFKCKKVKNHFERKKARFLLCWYKHEVSLEPHGHASQFVQVFGTAFLKSGGQSVFLSTSDHLNIVLNTETAINNQKKSIF